MKLYRKIPTERYDMKEIIEAIVDKWRFYGSTALLWQ